MRRIVLPLLVFFFFIFEGTVMQVFSPQAFGFETVIVPRFVMVMIVFIAMYFSMSKTLVYAIVVGILYDLIYTDLIGVYLFSMAFSAYVISLCTKVIHTNSIVGLLFSLISVTILDFLVYGIYTLIGIADLPVTVFLSERLFPSLIVNGVFFILMYYPMRRLFEKMKEKLQT